jgi:mannose-6-phosphate isomerase
MQQPLFLKPVFQERIWGGTALKNSFGYAIPSEHTGECWAISGHPNGPSIVENGPYAGKSLIELWEQNRELFGNYESKVFPLLTKILDANSDLSVQVHPDDVYAAEHENGELGKTECWYIIDCKEDAEIIYGHHAQTKAEFEEMVVRGEWDSLLRRIPIQPGDFFYLPSGMIHALCEGTLVLETQQNSDTTYRVYDYDRTDQDGNKRELHLEKALEVSTIPHQGAQTQTSHASIDGVDITTFVESEYFTVLKLDIEGQAIIPMERDFLIMSVIDGTGSLKTDGETYQLNKGNHFIVPHGSADLHFTGNMRIIVSYP